MAGAECSFRRNLANLCRRPDVLTIFLYSDALLIRACPTLPKFRHFFARERAASSTIIDHLPSQKTVSVR